MDSPERAFSESLTEAREDLWLLGNASPARPLGEEPTEYRPPSRFWLPHIRDAVAHLDEAKRMALAEVPESLRREANQHVRRHGPNWTELANREPELRRFYLVSVLLSLAEQVFDDLRTEGKPQPPPDLTLGRHRQR